MSSPARPERKVSIESKHFRIVYTNAFALRFGDNDVLIRFYMDTEPGTTDAPKIEEVGVVMTPRSAKILAHILTETIGAFEATSGPISIPEEKLQEISKNLRLALDARSASTGRKK